MTSRIASLHFAPTPAAARALAGEGVEEERIFTTGNTVIDALLETVSRHTEFHDPALRARSPERPFVLVTAHRRESFGEPLAEICRGLARIAEEMDGHDLIFPVHPNPSVRRAVDRHLPRTPNLLLLEPLPYPEFAALLSRARLVLTDSGGIQEEAPALDVPVLVMRETTERPEGLEAGTAKLVGCSGAAIAQGAIDLLRDDASHAAMASAKSPYGDGRAAGRIADALLKRLAPA